MLRLSLLKTPPALELLNLSAKGLLVFFSRAQPYINDIPRPARYLSPASQLATPMIFHRSDIDL